MRCRGVVYELRYTSSACYGTTLLAHYPCSPTSAKLLLLCCMASNQNGIPVS
uniref:Uncharacterized protein n=1 Tax=Anguilla anguilla TaxID=7936 RepID=A0A0E9QHC0_ANGAN